MRLPKVPQESHKGPPRAPQGVILGRKDLTGDRKDLARDTPFGVIFFGRLTAVEKWGSGGFSLQVSSDYFRKALGALRAGISGRLLRGGAGEESGEK